MAARTHLTEAETAFVAEQRVARLATADAEGHPHVVPVCYALDGARFVHAAGREAQARRRPRRCGVCATSRRGQRRAGDRPLRRRLVAAGVRAGRRRAPIAGARCGRIMRQLLALLRERYPQYRAMALEHEPLIIALTPTARRRVGAALRVRAADECRWLESGRGLDFLPLARGRQSVRAFQDRPVPRAALEDDDRGGALGALTTWRAAMALCRADT